MSISTAVEPAEPLLQNITWSSSACYSIIICCSSTAVYILPCRPQVGNARNLLTFYILQFTLVAKD